VTFLLVQLGTSPCVSPLIGRVISPGSRRDVTSGIGNGLQAEYIEGMESKPYDPDNLAPGMFVGEIQERNSGDSILNY